MNVDLNTIKNAITKKTKAIMLAHTLGNPFRADLFRKFCDKNSLYLIEDTCDAFGASINVNSKNKKNVGTFGVFAKMLLNHNFMVSVLCRAEMI